MSRAPLKKFLRTPLESAKPIAKLISQAFRTKGLILSHYGKGWSERHLFLRKFPIFFAKARVPEKINPRRRKSVASAGVSIQQRKRLQTIVKNTSHFYVTGIYLFTRQLLLFLKFKYFSFFALFQLTFSC